MFSLFAKTKPFLKWAGGKTQLLDDIAHRMPYAQQDKFTYVEPFVGGGSVLFWILNNYPNVQNFRRISFKASGLTMSLES